MSLHSLDLTPLTVLKVRTASQHCPVKLGLQTHPLSRLPSPHTLGSVALPTAQPTAKQLALCLYRPILRRGNLGMHSLSAGLWELAFQDPEGREIVQTSEQRGQAVLLLSVSITGQLLPPSYSGGKGGTQRTPPANLGIFSRSYLQSPFRLDVSIPRLWLPHPKNIKGKLRHVFI